MSKISYTYTFITLAILLVISFVLNISLGSVNIPLKDVIAGITGGELSKSSWEYIILDYRLPKAITAIIAGSGLAISGLLMQTLLKTHSLDLLCWVLAAVQVWVLLFIF